MLKESHYVPLGYVHQVGVHNMYLNQFFASIAHKLVLFI